MSTPRLTIAAAGTTPAWRRAALLLSGDAGERWQEIGATAGPAVLGVLAAPLATGSTALFDESSTVEVDLAHAGMSLHPADDVALDRGANLALVGNEVLQFGRAQQLSARRWRLSHLLRGRRGTEAAAGASSDPRFVLLDPATSRLLDLPLAAVGSSLQVMASGVADGAPVSCSALVTGRSVVPPSPVHLRMRAAPDGTLTLSWTRRSRAGASWRDLVDVPLVEEAERYVVELIGAAGAREYVVAAPSCVIAADDRPCGPTVVSVRQRGSYGDSSPATLVLEGE